MTSALNKIAPAAILGAALFMIPGTAAAQEQPTLVNFGLTSALDATLPYGDGVYYEGYLNYYSADRINDRNGDPLPLPKQQLDALIAVNQIVIAKKNPIGSGSVGLDLVLPILLTTHSNDGLHHAALKDQGGVGDLAIGLFWQMPVSKTKAGNPKFSNRFEFFALAPIGRYNPTYALQPGSNYWTFSPTWTFTTWLTPKWTASARTSYYINFRNNNPPVGYGPDVRWSRPGQSVEVNFATEYAVKPDLLLGIDSYGFKQTTNTRVDGHDIFGDKQQVFAVGPEFVKIFGKKGSAFIFNSYFETGARNRPQGFRLNARFIQHFK